MKRMTVMFGKVPFRFGASRIAIKEATALSGGEMTEGATHCLKYEVKRNGEVDRS